MTDAPPPKPAATPAAPADRRPARSRLAPLALALALIPCCPAVPLAGSMLGLVAHVRIRRAAVPVRGERMALAAMLVGSLMALVQMIALQRYLEQQVAAQRAEVAAAVRTSLDRTAPDWPAAALAAWASSAAMDGARLDRELAALETRLGPVVGVRLGEVRPAGGGLNLGRVWTGFLSVGGRDPVDRPVVVETLLRQVPGAGPGGILPGTRVTLRAIRVMLPDGGEVRLGTPLLEPEPEPESDPDPDPESAPDAEAPPG